MASTTATATASATDISGFQKDELDQVVASLKEALRDPELRQLSQRAVQAKVWHLQPKVSAMMQRLRKDEEVLRQQIMVQMSELIYKFHEHTLDTTLARAGILQDQRVGAGSSLDKTESFDLFCLDAKERLYLIMKEYDWLKEFFRLYPLHFYENSFQFVDRIPNKKLKVKVAVVGLGIGGSMAVSGLAKAGIAVTGLEKRKEQGVSSVGSRYQNASWRAYDVAAKMLDEQAYEELVKYRQQINIRYDDGSTGVMTSDRVQIILGNAIEHSIASAKRYGANLKFGVNDALNDITSDSCDIVALFAGAHTSEVFPEIKEEMKMLSWDDINSDCKMWLRIKESDKENFFCARNGEVGAEHWHYTIESARNTVSDIERVRNVLQSQYSRAMSKLEGSEDDSQKTQVKEKLEGQLAQLQKVQTMIEEGKTPGGRFDYIFTNAPTNEHNLAKRDTVAGDGSIVLEGGYTVEVKIASNAKFTSKPVREKFQSELVICGGDACVPPNPQAAYGATLACESADMVVQLAIATGHLNSILADMKEMASFVNDEWVQQVVDLKGLLAEYFNVRGRAENYFQFVQTLICNLYSLPPFEE